MRRSDRLAVRTIVDHLMFDFLGVFSVETVERFVVESFVELARAAAVPNYVPLLTERFARERLRALAQVQGVTVSEVPEVLFVCVHNAGRSQMAAALLHHHAQGRVHVRSAGSAPASEVNAAVVEAMAELGIDISKEFPKPLTNEGSKSRRHAHHHGLRRRLPGVPGEALPRLATDRPCGQRRRGGAPHPRRDRRPGASAVEELVPSAQTT